MNKPQKYGKVIQGSMNKRDDPLELLKLMEEKLQEFIPTNATTVNIVTVELDETDFWPSEDDEEPIEPPDFTKLRIFKMGATWFA